METPFYPREFIFSNGEFGREEGFTYQENNEISGGMEGNWVDLRFSAVLVNPLVLEAAREEVSLVQANKKVIRVTWPVTGRW